MKDILGNTLKVGDKVVYSYAGYCALTSGVVTRICKKTLYVKPNEPDSDDCDPPDVNRHPSGVVKV